MSAKAQQLRASADHRPVSPGVLDEALARLKLAIDGLESAVEGRSRADSAAGSLEEELQVLFEDRARLVHELDNVKARASRLDTVSAEVAGRLDAVIADIGTVLNSR